MRTKVHFDRATLLIILCWLVYTCSYIGKLSYSANINQIGQAFNVGYAQAGMVSTLFFFAYGAGQIINGLLCRYYNVKLVIFISLITGGAMNLLAVISPYFSTLKFFWLVNGIAMSFLWPSITRLISETLDKKHLNRAIVAMGTTVATGTFIVYGLSALFAATLSYKWIFYVATAILLAVALIWFFSYDSLVTPLKATSEHTQNKLSAKKATVSTVIEKKRVRSSILVALGLLAVFAVINNLVKDGLTSWTPDILSSLYSTPAWMSILLTLLLPALAIFGTFVALGLQRLTKSFVATCTLLFMAASVFILLVIMLLPLSAIVPTVAALAIVSLLMAGINNVTTSIAPLYLKDNIDSGRCAGILNGFCYLGSTLSSYGLGMIADRYGWHSVFNTLFGAVLFASVSGIMFIVLKHAISYSLHHHHRLHHHGHWHFRRLFHHHK